MSRKKYSFLIFAILGLAYILVFFHRLSPAVMAVDIMRDFSAGGALMGLMASAYFYPYALMQIPAGLLSDSWGPRRSVTAFLFFAAAGAVLFAISQSVGMAIFSRVLVGLGVSMVFVPTMKILTNWFEKKDFTLMTGLLISLGGVGAYTAATPLAMLNEALTWRKSMLLISGLTMIIGVFVWFLVRDYPEQKGFDGVADTPAVPGKSPGIGLLSGLSMVTGSMRFWPMAACFFFSAAVSLTFMGLWGGPFLMQVYGMTSAKAGSVLSMMALGFIFGAPVLSWVSENVYRSKKGLLVTHLSLTVVFVGILAFFTGRFPVPMLYIWCFGYSFLGSGSIVVGYTIIKEVFPIKIAGTATGLLNIFPFAGAAVGQPLMGWYLDRFGAVDGVYSVLAYSSAFKFCLVSMVIALVCSLLVSEKPAG